MTINDAICYMFSYHFGITLRHYRITFLIPILGQFACVLDVFHPVEAQYNYYILLLRLTLERDGMLRVSVLLVTPSVSLRMVLAVKGPGLSSVAEA